MVAVLHAEYIKNVGHVAFNCADVSNGLTGILWHLSAIYGTVVPVIPLVGAGSASNRNGVQKEGTRGGEFNKCSGELSAA